MAVPLTGPQIKPLPWAVVRLSAWVDVYKRQTFVTADVKYNGFLDAKALGVNLIDAGHYPTEQVVVPVLAKWLASGFPKVEILTTRCV